MNVVYGIRRLGVSADQYPTVAAVLQDPNLQVMIGRPDNCDVMLNGSQVSDSNVNLTESDTVEFVTKANKKGN